MKKQFVKTVATLALGMMIGSATLAAAAPSTIQAVLAKFTFSVDGQVKTLKNDPLVYNGTTYLPVREVTGMLNADVTSFDNKTKKIEIQTKEPVSQPSSTTTTPPTTSTTTPTDNQPEKKYSVGEVIETDKFKAKVIDVTYSNNFESLVPSAGNTFAIVKFDVLIDQEPQYSLNWYPTDFVDYFKLDSGKELLGNSHTTDKVTTKQWSTVRVLKEVPVGSKVSEVRFSDPVTRSRTFYTVSINQ